MNVYCLKSLVFTSHVRTDREIEGKKHLGTRIHGVRHNQLNRQGVRLYGTTLLQ